MFFLTGFIEAGIEATAIVAAVREWLVEGENYTGSVLRRIVFNSPSTPDVLNLVEKYFPLQSVATEEVTATIRAQSPDTGVNLDLISSYGGSEVEEEEEEVEKKDGKSQKTSNELANQELEYATNLLSNRVESMFEEGISLLPQSPLPNTIDEQQLDNLDNILAELSSFTDENF